MRAWWRSIGVKPRSAAAMVEDVRRAERAYSKFTDEQLDKAVAQAVALPQLVALTAVLVSRVLGLDLFDVQLHAALALADGKIVEMQTGEGKTVAAVPAIAWFARSGQGVHVLTANDYLARRDAEWMGGIYRRLGLSVGVVQQHMTSAERRDARTQSDITYGTANEVGFDYLRDQLVLDPSEQVLRPLAVAVLDEADSALIDEARIPLVIAGGAGGAGDLAARADRAVRRLTPWDRSIDESGRNVALTPSGLAAVERDLGCDLYAIDAAPMMAAVQESLHAHTLLRRDIDYVVQDGQVLSVDEFKGRIVRDRRWPGGLQTALEWKEGVPPKVQGRVLGSITVENLVALYPTVCGMSGTAATQARDFREMYDLDVEVIPDAPADDPRRSSGCGVRDEGRQGSRRHRRDSRDSCERTAGAGGDGQRAGVGVDRAVSSAAYPHQRAERAERGGRGRHHRARGRARRRHHFDEHGRTRRRHPAWSRRRGARRASRDRHDPIREPPHRSPAARARGPAGRSRQLPLLRLERRRADGQVRQRVRVARSGATDRRGTEPRRPAALAQVRNHRRSAAAADRAHVASVC